MESHTIAVLPLGLIESLKAQLEVPDGHIEHGQFLRLPHPRTGFPTLYLHSQSQLPDGPSTIVEVQTVSPHAKRSWFLAQSEVIADGKLLIMTPVDVTFLLFPIVQAAFSSTSNSFRTLEDIFELALRCLAKDSDSKDPSEDDPSRIADGDLYALSQLRCVGKAMRRICEFKDVTPEITVFRSSKEKFISYLSTKVRRLSEGGLLLKCDTIVRGLAKNELMDDSKEELLKSGLCKAACELVSHYIPPDIYKELLVSFDFTVLDAHIQELEKQTLPSCVNASGTDEKKSQQKSDEAAGSKRKAPTQQSKGVEKLKKANIKGMAKLSTFFQKPAAKS